jgi:hypothetical protein
MAVLAALTGAMAIAINSDPHVVDAHPSLARLIAAKSNQDRLAHAEPVSSGFCATLAVTEVLEPAALVSGARRFTAIENSRTRSIARAPAGVWHERVFF